jgi:hypothetical protein
MVVYKQARKYRNANKLTRFGGFLLPGVYMLTKSLLLTDQWDITLDDTGSMANHCQSLRSSSGRSVCVLNLSRRAMV